MTPEKAFLAAPAMRGDETGAGRRPGTRGRATSLLILLSLLATPVLGDFGPPTRITNGGRAASDCTLGVDGANNVYIVSVVNEELVVDVIGPNLRETLELPAPTGPQGSPDIISNSAGTTSIAFAQGSFLSEEVGREIYLIDNNGGRFRSFTNLSRNAFDDFSPRVDLDIRGVPHLVWISIPSHDDDTHVVVYYNHDRGTRQEVAPGTQPDVAMDSKGAAHIVFLRDNDVFYVNNRSGRFENEVRVVETPTEVESAPNITINQNGDIFITFEANGNLKFVSRIGDGQFSPQRLLDSGGITDPRLSIRSGSLLTIVYAKQGAVNYIQGLSTFLLEPVTLSGSGSSRTRPSLVADLEGNLHACFLENGDVFYTNNAGQVQADFTASPRTGEAPLKVSFQDLSSGDVAAWRWDFGDGINSRSSVRNPVYTFNSPGKYTVTLRVFNADRESRVVKQDFIVAQEAFNTLEIPDQAVVPNQSDVWFPVVASHPDPIRGFQVMATHDPSALTFNRCSLDNTATAAVHPEFFECNEFDSRVEVGVLFDFEPPFEFRFIPPGENQTILFLVYDVSNGAPQGAVTEVRLRNNASISRIFNIFTVDGFSKFPSLESSTVRILNITPPAQLPTFFLRGDVDRNGSIEITDAVKLLNFLFLGGPPPTCPDAADFNDHGAVDISGAIGILNFLFLGGAPPRPPFPNLGVDPIDDNLGPCE